MSEDSGAALSNDSPKAAMILERLISVLPGLVESPKVKKSCLSGARGQNPATRFLQLAGLPFRSH